MTDTSRNPSSPSGTNSLYTLLIFPAIVLVLIVVILSAYLRLAGSGLGCAAWPDCYALIKSHAGGTEALAAAHLVPAWATMIHRLAASALGLLVLGIAVLALHRRRQPGQHVLIPLIVLALTVFLSVLGYKTPSPLLPAVTAGNLLGGMAMLAMLWWLGQRSVFSGMNDARAGTLRPWALAGVLVVFFQIALGGWASANFAALACTSLPGCGGYPWLDGPWRESFNLLRVLPATDGGVVIVGDTGKVIHMVHRMGAVLTFLYITWLGWRAARLGSGYRGTALAMLVLLGTQVLLGVAAVMLGLPLLIVTAHNAVAALLLLSVVNLTNLLTPRTSK